MTTTPNIARLVATAEARVRERFRAAIFDVLDEGWRCSKGCDLHHPWSFPTEMYAGDDAPIDKDVEHRAAFADAVAKRYEELKEAGLP